MNYCAVGCEFNVNESTIYINKVSLNRHTHKVKLCIDQLMKMLCPEAHRNLTLYFSKEQWFGIH